MWKDIIGWEKYYEINDEGKVRNKLTRHIKVTDKNNCGYHRVTLYNKNNYPQKQRFFVHRLVAIHFINNPNNLEQINHIDSDKNNNCVSNLEWCSARENTTKSFIEGNANKRYRPFKCIFEDGTELKYNTTTELIDCIPVLTKSIVLSWFNSGCLSYKKYGIKNVYRL
jgi:hypothetical protein